MRTLTARLDRWMFQTYTAAPAELAVFRIAYCVYTLLVVLPAAPWLKTVPDAFYNPPVGFAALFTGFANPWVMLLLNAAAVVLLGLLLVGWRVKPVSVALSCVLLALKSFEYATGKVDHDVMQVITPLMLAGSGWGNALSVDAARVHDPDPRARRPCWQLAFFAFVIALAMSSAGVLKLVSGWMDPAVHATYRHMALNRVVIGRAPLLADLALRVDSGWLWKPADWATVVLESSFLVAIIRPRMFRIVLAFATLFHVGVWLLFDIVFAPNIVAYGAFFTGTGALAAWLSRRPPFRGWVLAPGPAVAAFAVVCAGGTAIAAGAPLAEWPVKRFVVAAAGMVGSVYLCRSAAAAWRGWAVGPGTIRPAPATESVSTAP